MAGFLLGTIGALKALRILSLLQIVVKNSDKVSDLSRYAVALCWENVIDTHTWQDVFFWLERT